MSKCGSLTRSTVPPGRDVAAGCGREDEKGVADEVAAGAGALPAASKC